MDSAMRPARLAVILGTVCALGAGAPAIALAAESPAPIVARQDAGASDLTTLTQFVSASGDTVTCEDGTSRVATATTLPCSRAERPTKAWTTRPTCR